ncbi:MAG TPA: TetR family transcriptional regulator, partial [Rugosimonospora sp.]|nr:TetR family transcriptional regulator [Rugosimonospora sp.]
AADRLALDAERALLDSPAPASALRAMVGCYVRALTASPDLTVALSIDIANLTDADRAELLHAQREYVLRWAGLLLQVHPELNPREARVTVHAALAIANDLVRTRRFATHPALPTRLVTLLTAALAL